MPSRERVDAFVAAVVRGDYVQSIRDFYCDDASAQENLHPPRVGMKALIAKEENDLRAVRSIVARPVETFLVDGDDVVIHWRFDIPDLDGSTRHLDELTLQRWRGDRIAKERFFYDPSSIVPRRAER